MAERVDEQSDQEFILWIRDRLTGTVGDLLDSPHILRLQAIADSLDPEQVTMVAGPNEVEDQYEAADDEIVTLKVEYS